MNDYMPPHRGLLHTTSYLSGAVWLLHGSKVPWLESRNIVTTTVWCAKIDFGRAVTTAHVGLDVHPNTAYGKPVNEYPS